jgi:uncharacterized membrane protein
MVPRHPKSSRTGKTLTRVAVGLGLVGACTVVDKGDYTFTDNPDATGGDAGDGTGGMQGGSSGSTGNGGTAGTTTAGEGGEATGGGAGDSGNGGTAGTSGDGGGGAGGDDPCDPNPCEHDSDCTSSGSTFTCDCAAGYQGTTCDEDIDECDPNPCRMNIACTNMLADFSCNCPRELMGKTCELQRFQPLPALMMDAESGARAVSADGSVVIGFAQGMTGNRVAMSWPGNVPMPPPMPLPIPTQFRDINVFPAAVSGNGAHWGGEFVGSPTMMVDAQPIGGSATMPGMFALPTGSTSGSIQDIDGNATKYVGWVREMGGQMRAYSWDSMGVPTPIPDFTGTSSSMAGAVTRDGLKVFGVAPDMMSGWAVVTWEGDSRNPPPPMRPPTNVQQLVVHGVDAGGTAVVGAMTLDPATFYAFVSQNSNLVSISPLQSATSTLFANSVAWDVSDDGKVIVGEAYVGTSPMRTAMRWHNVGPNMVVAQPIIDLLRNNGVDPMGWQLEIAYGVSADGTTIVGEGRDPMLRRMGFIARIPHP